MIRFVDLGHQLDVDNEGERSFAFFNTVTDQFISFDGEEAFVSIEEFKQAAEGHRETARYLELIPADWGKV